VDLSLVIPVYNEEKSLARLLEEIRAALDPTGSDYEVICVDDGSSDASFRILSDLAAEDPRVVVVQLRRNFGQTAAIQAGLDHTRGAVVALLDADLQNDPADIPMMVERLRSEGYDLVAGWRTDRKDALLNRRLPSTVANALIGRVTGVRLHDFGCTLKVMTREVADALRLYGEMHRFIPAIAHWFGARILEVKVNHRPRRFGVTSYGIGRTPRVLLDLLVVRFLASYLVKPIQVFGLWGLLSGGAGFAGCAWLTADKLLFDEPLADRPLLLLGVLLILLGVQLVSLGLVADVVGRTYHEAQGKRPYTVRRVIGRDP